MSNFLFVIKASSPDELALVNLAKFCGFEYMGMDEENFMRIKTPIGFLNYKLLHVLEFNSTRKRMSVILEDKEKNIIIMCKGADSILLERMDKNK
jgi:magnesium-transporting ATPase (P-type)